MITLIWLRTCWTLDEDETIPDPLHETAASIADVMDEVEVTNNLANLYSKVISPVFDANNLVLCRVYH